MRLLLCLAFLLFQNGLFSQEKGLQFPDDFFGVYKGNLEIKSPKGMQAIAMEFHLQPTDSIEKYEYRIVYIVDGTPQERHYNLFAIDAEKGEYVVDENNGILIPAKQFDNRLYSIFEVQNNLLTTTLEFRGHDMVFEIVMSNKVNQKISGDEEKGTPKVVSYPIIVSQRAILTKQ